MNDLLTVINRLCIELQTSMNAMGKFINAYTCDFNTIVNLYIKDTYIKKYLLENDYIKDIKKRNDWLTPLYTYLYSI